VARSTPHPSDAHPALIDSWFAELERLARRRADNRAAIAKHVETFLNAARDWEATTGERAAIYRKLMGERIERALASPWPSTKSRNEKLAYARRLLSGAKTG
jgi:hypothetical protein